MAQFGEVIHCHKPPYSGIPGEDFVNVRFASQDAADRAYAALKAGQVFIDGFQVGVGPTPGGGKGGGGGGGMGALQDGRRRSVSPPRHYGRNRQRSPLMSRRRSPPRRGPPSPPRVANFPSRTDPKSPSPRRLAREMHMTSGRAPPRSPSRSRERERERENNMRRYREPAPRQFQFSGGPSVPMTLKDKPARTPSPDPPGPVKNLNQVKNMFFKPNRSPTPELYEPERNLDMNYTPAVFTM